MNELHDTPGVRYDRSRPRGSRMSAGMAGLAAAGIGAVTVALALLTATAGSGTSATTPTSDPSIVHTQSVKSHMSDAFADLSPSAAVVS